MFWPSKMLFLFHFFFSTHSCEKSRHARFFGVMEMMDNLSFDRTIEAIHMNKMNTTTILEKYKMFPKCKAMMNIPFCRDDIDAYSPPCLQN